MSANSKKFTLDGVLFEYFPIFGWVVSFGGRAPKTLQELSDVELKSCLNEMPDCNVSDKDTKHLVDSFMTAATAELKNRIGVAESPDLSGEIAKTNWAPITDDVKWGDIDPKKPKLFDPIMFKALSFRPDVYDGDSLCFGKHNEGMMEHLRRTGVNLGIPNPPGFGTDFQGDSSVFGAIKTSIGSDGYSPVQLYTTEPEPNLELAAIKLKNFLSGIVLDKPGKQAKVHLHNKGLTVSVALTPKTLGSLELAYSLWGDGGVIFRSDYLGEIVGFLVACNCGT